MTNPDDIKIHNKEKELLRVHIFLAGLDAKHDNAKGQLLRQTSPPSLTEAFAYIHKDESQQESAKAVHSELSTLTVHSKPSPSRYVPPRQQQNHPQHSPIQLRPHTLSPGQPLSSRNRLIICHYCKQLEHYKSQWPKLVSKPNQGHVVLLVQNLDYYGLEGKDRTNVAGPPSVSLVGRGKIGITLKFFDFVGEDTWIVDSGASNHMTYDRSYFTHLSSPTMSTVTNANGEAFTILGTCSVQVTPSLTLHNVLYVPA